MHSISECSIKNLAFVRYLGVKYHAEIEKKRRRRIIVFLSLNVTLMHLYVYGKFNYYSYSYIYSCLFVSIVNCRMLTIKSNQVCIEERKNKLIDK